MILKNKKKTPNMTYSADKAKNIINEYVDQSADRLQKKLEAEWKKQAHLTKDQSYAQNSI